MAGVLASCPFCGHTLLLVTAYRRGARRVCDRCEEFSEFDGKKLIRAVPAEAVLARPLAKAEPGESPAQRARTARLG